MQGCQTSSKPAAMPRYQTCSSPCIRALGPCRLARRKHLSVNVCVARSASRSRDPPSRSFRLIDVWRGCRRREYQDRNSRTIKMRRRLRKNLGPAYAGLNFRDEAAAGTLMAAAGGHAATAQLPAYAVSSGRACRRSFSRHRCRPAYGKTTQDLHPEPLVRPWPIARRKRNRTTDACRLISQVR